MTAVLVERVTGDTVLAELRELIARTGESRKALDVLESEGKLTLPQVRLLAEIRGLEFLAGDGYR